MVRFLKLDHLNWGQKKVELISDPKNQGQVYPKDQSEHTRLKSYTNLLKIQNESLFIKKDPGSPVFDKKRDLSVPRTPRGKSASKDSISTGILTLECPNNICSVPIQISQNTATVKNPEDFSQIFDFYKIWDRHQTNSTKQNISTQSDSQSIPRNQNQSQ